MKHTRLLLASFGGLALALALLVMLDLPHLKTALAAPSATIRYVLGDGGTNTGDCTNPQSPCKSIQYALEQASDGDTIQVAKGLMPFTYAETISIDKSVTLEGGWGAVGGGGHLNWQHSSPCDASWTTIDAGGAGRAISITGNITPTIDCFTITGGDATGLGGGLYGNDGGGGIYSRDAAPLITRNVITANLAGDGGYGGGIYLLSAPATAVISGNLIANNVADSPGAPISGRGGGIMLRNSDALVVGNTIEDNLAGDGGGIGGGIAVFNGSPTIVGNDILSNDAGQAVVCMGGGLYVRSSAPVTVERNLFQSNTALNTASPGTIAQGGGLHYVGNSNGCAIIRDNVFRWNIAAPSTAAVSEGGGMYLTDLSAPSLVSGNTLEGNYGGHNDDGNGGGMYVNQSMVTIENNHLFDNAGTWAGSHGEGGGLYVNGGTVLIQSNVITHNYGAGLPGFPSTATGYGGGMVISGSLAIVQDNQIVGNNGTNGDSMGAGGGIFGFWGALHIEGNTIAENRATGHEWGYGGGLYLEETTPSLERNTIVDNMATGITGTHGHGGGIRINHCSAFTLTNNIVARNAASAVGSGVAITWDSVGDLTHNTIADNSGGDGVGVHIDDNSDVTLYNNIIVSHTVGITVVDPGSSTVNASYTLFEANTTDYGAGVGSSHEIAGPAGLRPNYRLKASSNAIDQGVSLTWVTDDIDGDARIYGAAPDVGADEVSCLARVGGVTYPSIQQAVNAATSGQTVQVARGTCYENVSVAKSVTLEGGWDTGFTTRDADPASASTIDGMGSGRAISITEVSGSIAVTVDGFTLTGGDATGLSGSPHGYDVGGGIYSYLADTTVSRCVVSGNVASRSTIGWGGGLGFYGGNATLRDSTVQNNTASTASDGYGGGAYFRSMLSATVDGNTIVDNVASTAGYGYGGGVGVHFGNVTLQDNIIYDNVASTAGSGYGGGVWTGGNSSVSVYPTISGGQIFGNAATFGGGIYVEYGINAMLTGPLVYANTATGGGGVYIKDSSSATLTGTHIYSNTAGEGGGVSITVSPDAELTDNHIHHNTADYGGGIRLNSSANATLTGNYVHDNEAWGLGGGLWISSCDNTRLTNNMVVENRIDGKGDAAGIFVHYTMTVRFEHTTLARNSGGGGQGIYFSSGATAWMTNTVVASHTVGIYVDSGCTAILEATLWGDGAWANTTNTDGGGDVKDGEIIVVGDPGFVDPDNGDYHIGPGSDAIDAGLDIGVPTDIDGDARPIGSDVDIGADEAWRWVFLPLALRNW
jgi:fibronectin-binding autotransporter adhesin